MNRRKFLAWLTGSAAGVAAASTLDVDKLLYVPGARTIFLPPPPTIDRVELMLSSDGRPFFVAPEDIGFGFPAAQTLSKNGAHGRYVVTASGLARVEFDDNWQAIRGLHYSNEGRGEALALEELAWLTEKMNDPASGQLAADWNQPLRAPIRPERIVEAVAHDGRGWFVEAPDSTSLPGEFVPYKNGWPLKRDQELVEWADEFKDRQTARNSWKGKPDDGTRRSGDRRYSRHRVAHLRAAPAPEAREVARRDHSGIPRLRPGTTEGSRRSQR
jgi:hypothetical protein